MEPEVIIIGAGGAGLMCAIHAGRRGRRVRLIDHSSKLGGKILISGGGRCNFTNLGASPVQYVSNNAHFAKSALSRYRPADFIEMVETHGIAYHEKKLGQQFCDVSARAIVDMLKQECDKAGVEIVMGCKVLGIERLSTVDSLARYQVVTDRGMSTCESLVIATGGLSIPKLGATGFGYEIARQFGLDVLPTAAALDGFTFGPEETRLFNSLSGVSIDCVIECNSKAFRENILFTHTGLSGPAALQASLHWHPGDAIMINLLPETRAMDWFRAKKSEGSRALVKNLLSELLPHRFADRMCELYFNSELPLPQVSERALEQFCERLHAWTITPSGTVGYSKAEVTRGGVNTDELSSKTMEAKKAPGLYFIGEVVDVTGWLGGYNFQWAWASGWAAGQVV